MVALIPLVWVRVALAACSLDGPPDAPFAIDLPDVTAMALVEVHTAGADPAWAAAIGDVLAQRGVHAVFVVDASKPVAPIGQEVAVEVKATSSDPYGAVEPLRAEMRAVKKTTGVRPRVAYAPVPRRTAEAILGLAGYRAILEAGGPATAMPHVAAAYQAQLSVTLVLPSGPYRGPCGTDPLVGPFTPAAADRASTAIRAAHGGVVRVALDGAHGGPDDARVLARWLDEVVLPAHVALRNASEARTALMASGWDASAATAGRFVALDDLKIAAEALRDVRTVPRELPGDLVPTEAWIAFARVLAEQADADVVQLRPIAGPRADARTALPGPVEVPRDEVVATARALLTVLPDSVPSALTVGGHPMTAGEILLLFASAVRGDAVPTTHPVEEPEPNMDGLGWGTSE